MSEANPTRIRVSTSSDRAGVLRLLVEAKLPTADLESATNLRFWIAEEAGRLVGAIGLERYGTAGLVRSLVVAPSHRNSGCGRRLLAALEHAAPAADVSQLVLLTETAEPFFRKQGYRVVERGHVPDEIKGSAEFRSLCPASAVCMTKSMQSPPSGAADG